MAGEVDIKALRSDLEADDRDFRMIAEELGCERTREDILKAVRALKAADVGKTAGAFAAAQRLTAPSDAQADELVLDVQDVMRKHFPHNAIHGIAWAVYAIRVLIAAHVRRGTLGPDARRVFGDMISRPVKGWPEDL
jgi:hypothetical protein